MPTNTHDTDEVAIRLALALKRLRARLREESWESSQGLSISQLSILQNLHLNGPTTAAALAAAEHVSGQAIAQNIMPLKAAGLVQLNSDPKDGRKVVINITESGQSLRESRIASRHAWLSRTITATIDPEEQKVLERAIELLDRLANVDLLDVTESR